MSVKIVKQHRLISACSLVGGRCSVAMTPVLAVGTVFVVSAIAPAANAASFVGSRDLLNATDQVNWETLGPVFDPVGPPSPGVFLPDSFVATSDAGRFIQVDIPTATAPGVLPPFVFQTTPEPGIATNFDDGDFVLFTGLRPGPPPAVGNPGPVSVTFLDPVFGAGAQIAVDDIFSFTGTISAFDRDDQLLESFSAPGTSSLALDNSALFLGVVDAQPRISKLVFESSVPGSAIGLNQLSLVTSRTPNQAIPDSSAPISSSIAIALGLLLLKQKR